MTTDKEPPYGSPESDRTIWGSYKDPAREAASAEELWAEMGFGLEDGPNGGKVFVLMGDEMIQRFGDDS